VVEVREKCPSIEDLSGSRGGEPLGRSRQKKERKSELVEKKEKGFFGH